MVPFTSVHSFSVKARLIQFASGLGIASLLVASLFASALPVFAQSPSPEPLVQIEEAAGRPGPTFAANSQVSLSETYTGPVFAAGGQVNFSGTTTEDLVVAGGTVTISGTVQQDVYAAGGSVILSGDIQGNLIVAGGEVQVLPTARIGGSLISAGERLRIEAPVARSSWVNGENILIAGSIAGDLNLNGDDVTLADTATIAGNVNAVVDEEEFDDQAQVQGVRNVTAQEVVTPDGPATEVAEFLYNLGWRLVFLGMALLLFPALLKRGADRIVESPSQIAINGMVWLAAVPIIALILLLTVIGIPLAAFLGAFYLAVLLLSWVFPTFALGERLLPGKSAWLQALVAVVIVTILGAIPIIGTVVDIVLAVLGAGALWSLARQDRSRLVVAADTPVMVDEEIKNEAETPTNPSPRTRRTRRTTRTRK